MMSFDSLLDKKEAGAFNADIKQYLLTQFSDYIHKHIQPQMGGFIDKKSLGLSILNGCVENAEVTVKCSIFYIEHIGGCNCNDGPHEENGYFEQTIRFSESHIVFI